MADKFEGANYGLNSIPSNAEVITPSDTVDLANVTRRIHIGTGGDLKVDLKNGGTVEFLNLPDGSEKTGAFTRVYATVTSGNAASDLIAEW